MEFTHLSVLALFFLTIIVGNASKSGEVYWKSVWPNTPMPKALSDLLLSDSITSVPIKGHEEKQYWTAFFQHDLYPGKQISLGIKTYSDVHSSQSKAKVPVEKISQPFGINIWWDQKSSDKTNQPLGILIREDKTTKLEILSQPFQKVSEKINQPFGFSAWFNPKAREIIKVANTWDEKEAHILHDYCGRPSAIGEEKHCVLSLESMMDFAISKLGKNIKVISSSFAQNQDHYVVEEVKKLGDKAVMCHRLNFKKVVFYCHQVNATIIYMVPLVSLDGTKSKALTICHHDTRGMDPNMLYEVLKVKPGTVPICHFIGNKAVAWVPNDDVNESNVHPCVI